MKVLVTGDFAATRLDALRAAAPDAEIVPAADTAALCAAIGDADVVAGEIPPEALPLAGRLRWVHSWLAGPDPQLYPAFVAHPATFTCSKSNGAIPLAEHAMLLMLMLNRNALRWIDSQAERRWAPFVHGELNGLTVGIIGTGFSGADLALKARAFHMRVVGMRRGDGDVPGFDRMYRRDELHAMLAESDFVVVTAPLTAETRGMLGPAEFAAMKRTAFYICFSRGGIADDDALLAALRENRIAGAGLDAHAVEPLPAESAFWTAPNTIVTPHNGAGTAATPQRGFDIFRDNLARWMRGEPLQNLVDKAAGY